MTVSFRPAGWFLLDGSGRSRRAVVAKSGPGNDLPPR